MLVAEPPQRHALRRGILTDMTTPALRATPPHTRRGRSLRAWRGRSLRARWGRSLRARWGRSLRALFPLLSKEGCRRQPAGWFFALVFVFPIAAHAALFDD